MHRGVRSHDDRAPRRTRKIVRSKIQVPPPSAEPSRIPRATPSSSWGSSRWRPGGQLIDLLMAYSRLVPRGSERSVGEGGYDVFEFFRRVVGAG